MKPSHPDAVFGPDEPIPTPPTPKKRKVTYTEVVDFLETMDKRALTTADADDILSLLDYMHAHCLGLFKQQRMQEEKLNEREAFISKREAEIALKQRAVDAILKMHPYVDPDDYEPTPPRRRYFWSK
jgi:hypothetical protein